MKVCFYTNGHLGDFIITIPFLNLLIEKYPENEYYQCVNGSDGTVFPEIFLRTVSNLKATDTPCGDINIPTWFCDPVYSSLHMSSEQAKTDLYPFDMVTIQKHYWKSIFEKYNFDIEVPDDIGIDFDFNKILDKKSIKSIQKLSESKKRKILFVNIKGRSGQTDNDNWLTRISAISKLYPDNEFYYTNEEDIELSRDGIIHTPLIFGDHPSDIIHNSYLSTFCDIIVAKNSGAFQAISMQNQNVLNEDKIFISQTKNNEHAEDLECFYNRPIYKATNIHTRNTQETFYKLEEILWSCQ